MLARSVSDNPLPPPRSSPAAPLDIVGVDRSLLASEQFNLAHAKVLILERSQTCVELVSGVLTSFGARDVRRCVRVEEAQAAVRARSCDLFIVDPTADQSRGYEFIRWLRRSNIQPACYAPIILVVGHARVQELAQARDSGANFLIAKPIVPKILLQRILWVARTPRLFICRETYVGPDRRFRDEGPPLGVKGRRAEDQHLEI